jgi:hypothetical protein
VCSGSAPDGLLADLGVQAIACQRGIHLPEPTEPETAFDAARGLSRAGWARSNDRAWAQARLKNASALYQKIADPFGEIFCHLALRAIATTNGDQSHAEEEAAKVRTLAVGLSRGREYQDPLTDLGQLAFNEFSDKDLARFIFGQVKDEFGLWETSPLLENGRPKDWLKAMPAQGPGSFQKETLAWVALRLANEDDNEAAREVFNDYALNNVDPERLDFRGLRKIIAGLKPPTDRQQQILNVLEVFGQPGDRSNELKQLLKIPPDEDVPGP